MALPSREYPSAPIVGVGAVVIDQGRVLLVRRNREPLIGQWSVPGGAVELGETLEQAIVREVAEETGLSIMPVSVLKVLDRIERNDVGKIRFHYILIDFLCQSIGAPERPRPASDVSDARWTPVDMLRRSKEFILTEWALEVIEEGQRRSQK